jgi:uncharacterized protein (TIGR02118 family)
MSIEKQVLLVESRDDEPAPDRADSVANSIAEVGGGGLPGVVGLTVSTVLEPLTGTPRALAVVQVWVEVSDGVKPGDVVEALVGDQAVETSSWSVEEIVFRAPVERESTTSTDSTASTKGINLFGTAFKRDDFTLDAFFDYWIDTHAHISGSVPGAGGYVVSRVRDARGFRAGTGTDAFVELWYPDRPTFDAAGASPQQADAWADVQRYAKTTGEFWITRERVVVAPPPTGPGTLEAGQ